MTNSDIVEQVARAIRLFERDYHKWQSEPPSDPAKFILLPEELERARAAIEAYEQAALSGSPEG